MPLKNPLDVARTPDNQFQDIEDLARDLAYGALNGYWGAVMRLFRGHEVLDPEDLHHKKFLQKWNLAEVPRPSYELLMVLGYLRELPVSGQYGEFLITEKSFQLLNSPIVEKSVFISYRRRESSAFALLIEARLRLVGISPGAIFVDKNMHGGERWEARIYKEIERCDFFVCLVGPATLANDSWVIREVELVKDINPQAIVVPVCHNGTRLGQLPNSLAKSNGYELGKPQEEETALDYETATNFILNAMGYKTY
jgi:hypothetical protein